MKTANVKFKYSSGEIMIYQLPPNGNVMGHQWTEKLYKIIK